MRRRELLPVDYRVNGCDLLGLLIRRRGRVTE
jgi:hypothetical protein